jgi:putative Mn2+ efflux pump MntP
MASPAQSRGLRKGTRDLFQSLLAVLAAGGATAVIELVVDSVNPAYGVVMAFAFKILIAYAQNYLETAGKIPVLLPTPGLVPSVGAGAAVAVGTVDAVAEKVGEIIGEVTGTVQSTTGELMGVVRDVDHEEG